MLEFIPGYLYSFNESKRTLSTPNQACFNKHDVSQPTTLINLSDLCLLFLGTEYCEFNVNKYIFLSPKGKLDISFTWAKKWLIPFDNKKILNG